jgi:ABC-type phosphate transport system substrate-binding protein
MAFNVKHIILLTILTISSGGFNVFAQNKGANDFVILGNDIGIKSSSVKHIQSIFRGKYSSWSNKQGVIIVLPSKKNESCAATTSFLYETSITAMQKFWLSQVFQGRSNAPVFLDTDEEIIIYVQKNPGAIGIIKKPVSNISPTLIINIIN